MTLPRLWIYSLLVATLGCGEGGGVEPPAVRATRLSIVIQPSTPAQSGVSFAAPPVVQLQDDQGASVAQAGIPVSVSLASGEGSIIGATTVNTSRDGQATFAGLALRGTVGARTLSFTAPDLPPVVSASIELVPGPATLLVVLGGDEQEAAVGSPVATPPSVAVTDADNNRTPGVPVTFQVSTGGGTALPTTPVNTDANGVAAIASWTLGAAAGPNTLTATAAGVTTGAVVFTATGLIGATITGTITISSGPAAVSRGPHSRPRVSSFSRPPAGQPEYTRNELLVTFRPRPIGAPALGSSAFALRSTATAIAGQIRSRLSPHLSRDVAITGVSPVILAARVRVSSPADVAQVVAALHMDPAVATVERSGILTPATRVPGSNDPLGAHQAWHYGMIDLPEAWAITTGSQSVLVAVVDDGIRFDHPEIAANLTSDGYDFVTDAPLPLCSGGTVSNSGDGDNYDPDPTTPATYDIFDFPFCLGDFQSSGNHGLHMAGTIGAVGNDQVGVSGVNWSVRIRPVRVLGAAGGTPFDVAQGVLYAAGLPADDGAGGIIQAPSGARVINMSFGGSEDFAVLRDAVTAAANAGALMVASAGNDFGSGPNYPAAYPEVLAVSAVGPDRKLAEYSNLVTRAGIAAPGGNIIDRDFTFGVTSTMWNFITGRPTHGIREGSSISVSHVSGVAALVLAQNPGLTSSELRSRLTTYAVDAGAPGPDEQYGAGIINARNSLAQNLGPPRQLRARLYDAVTGAAINTVAVAGDGSYTFTVPDGGYRIFAGQDEAGDQQIGAPGRRWGAFGGTATPAVVTVDGPGVHHASFSIGVPAEAEPNGTFARAHLLPVGGYLLGRLGSADVDMYRVLIGEAGEYSFETVPVDGACGFALEGDTMLRLYDATGALITSNDDIDASGLNFCSRITRSLAPGVYRIDVQGEREGTYQIQVRSGR